MPGETLDSLSPPGLRPRRLSQSSNCISSAPPIDEILFPKVYEDAWGNCASDSSTLDERSELDRSRIFLMRIGTMNPDAAIRQELRSIAADRQHNRTVTSLAAAVQTRILGGRHANFAVTALLQAVRFMLIKARVPDAVFTDRTRSVVDFFFDPAIAVNLEALPEDYVVYKYPAARLKIAIVGGGPTALASAISLAEKGAGKVEVNVFERRWVAVQGVNGRTYVDYPPTAKRRDQVVTLQESVTSLLSDATREALFEGRPERVWPGSANLQIRKPLNVFLTLGQTRYLLNASDCDGRGYLNMQLTEEEWHKIVAVDGQPITFGYPGCLRRPDGTVPDGFTENQVFAPSEDRDSALWKAIEDGLKLFGFKESEVINVVRIPIVVQAVQEGVQYLPQPDCKHLNRPGALVAVAGDAAMTVHFWPGRGLNSGIKSGIALGDEIVHALDGGRFVGLRLDAMKEYNDFILKLQDREHDRRSIPILNQSGAPETLGWLLSKAHTVPDNVAIEWLVGAMVQIADRLQRRDDWAYPYQANVEPQLRIVLRQLHSLTLREMAVSFPWPTREMAGAEVLPVRSMQPEEKERWLKQLWGMLTKEASTRPKDLSPHDGEKPVSTSRFEAPRQKKLPSMYSRPPFAEQHLLDTPLQLRRSNASRPAVNTPARFERGSTVPDSDEGERRGRVSVSNGLDDGGLVRLLSVKHSKSNNSVLADAMSLALFRVGE
ncbi:Fha domain containing protein [Coniochaeta hoffmannii]|uniref:Fha domain containing protein n=1 Tax=Coniochaeta hoffmannii TaxID=91930 RepID=A0AA38RIW2_9PEZI|nr:Fha domain containing protein [Coniochaeta hoffmannii]